MLMIGETEMRQIDSKIQLLKKTALELQAVGERIPAVEKNTSRILASIKMLELNVSDVVLPP